MYLLVIAVLIVGIGIGRQAEAHSMNFLHILLHHPISLLAVLPNVLSFYGHYFWVFPRFLAKGKWMGCVLAALLVSAGSTFVGLTYFGFWEDYASGIFEHLKELAVFSVFLILVATVHGILALIISGAMAWYESLKEKEVLLQKNHAMEMELVKSQLNPHFLFNTLNNIDVLIGQDPTLASRYLHQLSDIMRFGLYEAKDAPIPLLREVDYLRQYIALQQIRFANPDRIRFETVGDLTAHSIVPMILIGFVENAFKHAEGIREAGTIAVRIEALPGAVRFFCANKFFEKNSPNAASGLGNQLVIKRLQLTYPDRHQLDTVVKDHTYTINLTLQNA